MISVLLPTVRPILLNRCFDSIAPAAGNCPYEVVVIADYMAPFEIPLDHVCWFLRPRRGVSAALIEASDLAHGDYIFLFNDESVLEPKSLELLHAEAVSNSERILTPLHLPVYTFQYYGIPFAPFPFGHRDLFKRIGGVADSAFKAFYIDPDLGMRAHQHGVPTQVVEAAVLHHHNGHDEAKQQNVNQYMATDQATFRAKWDHLGAFYDC